MYEAENIVIAVVILGNINDGFLGYPNKIMANFNSKKSFRDVFLVHNISEFSKRKLKMDFRSILLGT